MDCDQKTEVDLSSDDPGPDTLAGIVLGPVEQRVLDDDHGFRGAIGQPGRVLPPDVGAMDAVAPIIGPLVQPGPIDGMRLYEQLPPVEKAKFVKRWQESQPDYMQAETRKRRERIRLGITIAIFAAILIASGIAIYAGAIEKTQQWADIKDWLAIALAPLVAAATLASMFWFPSKEAE